MHLLLLRHHPSQKPSLSLHHLLMFLGLYLLIEIGTGIRSHMFSTGPRMTFSGHRGSARRAALAQEDLQATVNSRLRGRALGPCPFVSP